MTTPKITLELKAESTEGIHDFIELLEMTIERIKEGYEEETVSKKNSQMQWRIIPVE